jgi:mono/diheme cytochrome c family protein
MRAAALRLIISLLVLWAMGGRAYASEAPAAFDKDIRPLLDAYCIKCHGGEKTKGDVNLARFSDVPSIQREPKLWRTVLTQLNHGDMPPEGKPQPSQAERALIVQWVQHTLTHFDPSHFAKDPGRVTLRRLNRFEYNNTVRDLFGVASKPADAFPADAGGSWTRCSAMTRP